MSATVLTIKYCFLNHGGKFGPCIYKKEIEDEARQLWAAKEVCWNGLPMDTYTQGSSARILAP